jgi:hypothetical protein
MASQPVPAGNAVAIVSNGIGAGVLAAGACAEADLTESATGPQAREPLREVLPREASLDGPVDTTAAVGPEAFGEVLRIAAEDGVGALIAVIVQHDSADLLPALSAAQLPVPVAAVVLDQPEVRRLSARASSACVTPSGRSTSSVRECRMRAREGRTASGRRSMIRTAAPWSWACRARASPGARDPRRLAVRRLWRVKLRPVRIKISYIPNGPWCFGPDLTWNRRAGAHTRLTRRALWTGSGRTAPR